MADLPILFSGSMVRAILREIEKPGTGKTQTRRVLAMPGEPFDAIFNDDGVWRVGDALTGQRGANIPVRYKPGDRLYVREHWRVSKKWEGHSPAKSHNGKPVLPPRRMTVLFEASGSIANQESGRWEPSSYEPEPTRAGWVGKLRHGMHMPRWASRITLIVEGVKIERLQDISEANARAEGIAKIGRFYGLPESVWDFASTENADDNFAALWESINGAGSWDANLWVVAYTFRPILCNIDQIGGDA